MSESLASFRDLKGIGPATEARLHEAGVFTWEALGAAAAALAAVRGNGDTLREVADLVAAQRTEAEGQAALRLPDGERLEAFVLRMALTADGEPRRCTVTHVRTAAEQAWAGWAPAELARFIEKHSGLQAPAAADFGYRATLAARRLGADSPDSLAARRLGADSPDSLGARWTDVGSQAGTGHPARELALRFPAVQLPAGIHRLQLRVELKLPAPARRPPALALALG